jgi:NADPH-dependent 2,4-dienoyl-CoA reductase/sulfur reductase-like enzyme
MADKLILVVGAGPAGVRAAEALVAVGLRPIVVDEGARDGGQIYRRQPEGFTRSYAELYGTEATRAAALHRSFDRIRERIDYRPRTLLWNIWDDEAHLLSAGETRTQRFDAMIICAGATDRLLPIAGWNRAGCYSLGAAQIALKSQACAIGRRVVFMGTGPLLYLVAKQYVAAGADVAAVLDTSPFSARVTALPDLLARPDTLAKGVALTLALLRRGVTLATGVTPLAIDGDDAAGVRGVTWRDAAGREHRTACDAVGLGFHLRPETQLADIARCEFRFDTATRHWQPVIDAEGRSTRQGVYLAGDGARILGADGAELSGRLAAFAVLADHGHPTDAAERRRLQRDLERMDRFRRGLARAFPWPAQLAAELPDDVVICRCEVIRAGEIRRAASELGAAEVNRAKAFSRVGMGRCQGRYCGDGAAALIAARCGGEAESVGRLRSQAPIKPLPIGTRVAPR